VVRLPAGIHENVHKHLFSGVGEHFAFLHARTSSSLGAPIFLVRKATLVPDECVTLGWDGYEIDSDLLLDVVNDAVRSGDALVEAHNHGGLPPRFSRLDRVELREFVSYALDSLPGRPYAATVWGEHAVYGEWYMDGRCGPLRSITSVGRQFLQVVSRDNDVAPLADTFDRQLAWFTEEGQRRLGKIRVGIVGLGGTGSHLALNLPFLGVRDFLLVDPDESDLTSMNRLVTATAADVATAKVIIARRTIKSIAPDAAVAILPRDLRNREALVALKGVDVLFGCFDNDGARLILNELAVAYGIPYFDLATGIDAETGQVVEVGGRLAVVLPGGPCLLCMNEIDREEAAFVLSTPEQQAAARERGYVRGMPVRAPAVVSLNGAIAMAAVNELATFVSGLRIPHPMTILDLLGIDRPLRSQWLTPSRVSRDPGCVHCAAAWSGDATDVERYAC